MRQVFGPILAVSFLLTAAAAAGESETYVVTHVDVAPLPPAPGESGSPTAPKTREEVTAQAVSLLLQLAAESRQDPGCLRFDVLQEPLRPNHFTLIQVWRDDDAFVAHESAAHTRATREKLQPPLASPFDQRLHRLLQ